MAHWRALVRVTHLVIIRPGNLKTFLRMNTHGDQRSARDGEGLDPPQASPLVMRIIGAVALAHLINDLIQAILPSIYPMLKASYNLSFTQIGLITLTFQITASLLQPWVGYYTDRHPNPLVLPVGSICTLSAL